MKALTNFKGKEKKRKEREGRERTPFYPLSSLRLFERA
jgi:hypothetical protein